MRGMVVCTLLLACVLAIPQIVFSQAESDTSESSAPSWITRNLHRYFGGKNQQAGDLQGTAIEVSAAYLPYAGRPIEVVLVHQVASFKEGWNKGKPASQKLLIGVTGSIQSYTQDSVIRDYLLFEQGDLVDPFALADSEVLLRQLPYINDVRIVVVPLQGDSEGVAVVVETTDRWPLGVSGKVETAERYSVDLYSENVGGLGIRFSNEVLHDSFENPDWGYRGQLSKDNIEGTFLGVALEFEDSFDRRIKEVRVGRRLAHPGLHLVGGLTLTHADEFGGGIEPRIYDHFDVWLGDVYRVGEGGAEHRAARAILVPGIRYFQRNYTKRPQAAPDSNRAFHHREVVLAALTYQRFKSYQTSYLLGDGETEDYPVGYSVQLSSGYEKREFQDRIPVLLDVSWNSLRHRGEVSFLKFETGGYLHHQKLEEGLVKARVGHFTRLMNLGPHRVRLKAQLEYTLGLERYPSDRIFLGDRYGIRDLSNTEVEGDQRLTGTLETRMFTRMSLWGFRFSFFGFADAGLVGAEDSSSIFKEKVYVSTGLGVRLRNPSLVLPTVQMQLSFLSNVDTPGMAFSFKVSNVSRLAGMVAGTRPELPKYQ